MKKIYIPQGGGRDFWLRIPMNNESAGRHLCMDDVDENDMHVWLESGYGGCWTLVWEKDGAQRDGIAAKVPASFLGYGTYSVVMAGKFVNGDSFRTKRQLFIRLVDREDQADAEPTMYNEEQAYWAGPAVLSEMLSRDGLNTYELWILQGNEGSLEDYLSVSGLTLNDFMVQWNHLSVDVQSRIDRAEQTSINPRGDYNEEVEYQANDLVYDSETLSSYVSLLSHNTGNPVTDTTYWMKVLDGDDINQIKQDAEDEIDDALQDARTATTNAVSATTAAEAVVAQKVADAQIGYYECNTAAGTSIKATTTNTIGQSTFAVPVKGCIVKVKMANANTATDTVYLQFGSDANTKKELKYNGLAVDASNTWDAGEVISVFYDGTYYQASNAQGGGGSSVKKKTLTFGSGYYDTTNAPSQGAAPNSRTSSTYCLSVRVPVSEGDCLVINGKAYSYNSSRLWATIDSSNNYVKCSEISAGGTDYIIIIPEGVVAIVINCDTRAYANPSGYLIKKGNLDYKAVTDLYIYGDLRTLSLGQTYKENESVKTSDKQLLRLTKEVKAMNLVDTITVGDLKTYGSGSAASTYKALKEVKEYNGTETEGLYAIGRPSIITISVDASSLSIEEDTDISVIIGEDTQPIAVPAAASETKDADIAALIAAAFTSVPRWTLIDNEDGTLTLRCNTGGPNTITVSSNVGETGLSITSSAVSGAATLSKYVEGTWAAVTLADYAADSINPGETADGEMWQKLSLDDLLSIATIQNTLVKTSEAKSISYNNSQSVLAAENVQDAIEELEEEQYEETLIFNKSIGSSGLNDTTAITTPVGFKVGKKYKITVTISSSVSSVVHSYLRYVAADKNPYIRLNPTPDLSIPAGETTKTCYYIPSAETNYQYFYRWSNVNKVVTTNWKVYEITGWRERCDIIDSVGTNIFDISSEIVGYTNSGSLIAEKTESGYNFSCASQNINMYAFGSLSGLIIGNQYQLTFDYEYDLKVTSQYAGLLRLVKKSPLSSTTESYKAWTLKNYTSPGSITYRFTAEGNSAYFRVAANDLGTNGSITLSNIALQNLGKVADIAEMIVEDMVELDTEMSKASVSGTYSGRKIPAVNTAYKFGYSLYMSSGGNGSSRQGCAAYNGYLFEFGANNSYINIYNLATKTFHSTVTPTNISTGHCNTACFSTKFFDANDTFPLLYVSGDANAKIQVYRVTLENDVFAITQVQDITMRLTLPEGSVTWGQGYLDNDKNRLWWFGASVDNKNWFSFAIPSIFDGDNNVISAVTLASSDIIESFRSVRPRTHLQGGIIVDGILYEVQGVPAWGDTATFNVVNMWGMEDINSINLSSLGWNYEPEGVAFYDGHLYVNTQGNGIYILYIGK